MGSESNSATAPTPSPSGKRSRDLEDEVYVDNLHSHKRYLSEIMASSLNGLTVGDSLPENLMESPARDEFCMQYSPMSEDSDDSRFCEPPPVSTTCTSQPDSIPTSPVSPYRYQRPFNMLSYSSAPSSSSIPTHATTSTAVSTSQPRQRVSDSEGRYPSSPSDICHSADLRRAALLRSVQMRTHPPGMSTYELPYGSAHESVHSIEAEERPCSYMKSLVDEREYHIEDCSSMSHANFGQQKPCRALDMSKENESLD